MPIYEYQCIKCDMIEERLYLHGKDDCIPNNLWCTNCNALMKRIMSAAEFQLKWQQRERDEKAGRVLDE